MNGQPYDHGSITKLENRVRDLEERDRASSQSRKRLHEQMEKTEQAMKEGFSEVAEAVNDLGAQFQAFMLSSKGKCPVDETPCPKGDIPWIKQWLIWIGAGEVGLAAFIVTWMLTQAGK